MERKELKNASVRLAKNRLWPTCNSIATAYYLLLHSVSQDFSVPVLAGFRNTCFEMGLNDDRNHADRLLRGDCDRFHRWGAVAAVGQNDPFENSAVDEFCGWADAWDCVTASAASRCRYARFCIQSGSCCPDWCCHHVSVDASVSSTPRSRWTSALRARS